MDTVCFWAIVLGLALTPFWFGGDRLIAWGAQAVWFPAITFVYELTRLSAGVPHPIAPWRLAIPLVAFAAVAIWALIQMSSATPTAVEYPVWQMARATLGIPVSGAISIDPDETMISLLKLTTGGCLFWTTSQLCRSSGRARRLIEGVAAIGLLYAVYGIIAFFVYPDTILWSHKIYYNESVTSTFVNRNSYATYAGVGLVAAIALAFSHFSAGARSSRARLANFLAMAAGPGGAWLAVAFVIAMALMMTGSRGGISASLLGILVLTTIAAIRGRSHIGGVGVYLLAALALLGGAAFAFGDYLAARLAVNGFEFQDRLAVYQLGLLSIANAPLLGYGLGTFREVFPLFRDSSMTPFSVWDLAHNSYIELFQGLGIPFGVIFMAAMVWLASRCALAALSRKYSATVPIVAISATFLVALHAFVDFSLQIQAVALTWIALLAAGAAQSWSSRVSTER